MRYEAEGFTGVFVQGARAPFDRVRELEGVGGA